MTARRSDCGDKESLQSRSWGNTRLHWTIICSSEGRKSTARTLVQPRPTRIEFGGSDFKGFWISGGLRASDPQCVIQRRSLRTSIRLALKLLELEKGSRLLKVYLNLSFELISIFVKFNPSRISILLVLLKIF